MWAFTDIIFGILALFVVLFFHGFWKNRKVLNLLKNKNVVITGGSSGIGLSIAEICHLYGANVTIIGRKCDTLQNVKTSVLQKGGSGKFEILSLDITCDYKTIDIALHPLTEQTDILINCAGGAVSKTYVDTAPLDIEAQMKLNYLGAANISHIFLPSMLKRNTKCAIVFVSSMAGQIGLYGFGAYSASKFALRGLAESLQMEVKYKNVQITIAFPPDTRTPGFENEQKGKPETTKKLSEGGGLLEPNVVAEGILLSAMRGQFFCSFGFDGWLVTQLTYGMCLPSSFIEATFLVILSPIIRLISIGYRLWMNIVIRKTSL